MTKLWKVESVQTIRRAPAFQLPLDSTVMFRCVFTTCSALPQSQDSVKFLFLPAINTFVLRPRKWSKVVTSHYMDEPRFLTPVRLLSSQILPADPQRPSEPNICLTNLLHLSLPWQTGSPTSRANPSRCSVSPLCVATRLCVPWRNAFELSNRSRMTVCSASWTTFILSLRCHSSVLPTFDGKSF